MLAASKLVDLTMRYALPTFGVGARWLKEELHSRGVDVRVTEACVRELVADAESAATLAISADATETYALALRRELATRAEFLRAWTRSDDRVDVDPSMQHLASIARKYALPRAWTLTVPMAAAARHPTPTYLYWGSLRSA